MNIWKGITESLWIRITMRMEVVKIREILATAVRMKIEIMFRWNFSWNYVVKISFEFVDLLAAVIFFWGWLFITLSFRESMSDYFWIQGLLLRGRMSDANEGKVGRSSSPKSVAELVVGLTLFSSSREGSISKTLTLLKWTDSLRFSLWDYGGS